MKRKRTLAIIITVAIAVLITACGNQISDPAVGHWRHTYTVSKDGDTYSMLDSYREPYKYTIDITSDGTYIATLIDGNGTTGTDEGKWTISNSTYILENGKSEGTDLYLTLENDKLIEKASTYTMYFEKNIN